MSGKVLILGGTGNFGKRIAEGLVTVGIPIVIAGRNRNKADKVRWDIGGGAADTAVFDIRTELDDHLLRLKPQVVVNTCGPFQTSDYSIVQSAIRHGAHYVDLADGRDFVSGIAVLDAEARAAGVAVISGASTVPGLSSAVLDHYKSQFSEIEKLKFGISPGQKAERGLATTKGVLNYVGKPLNPFQGSVRKVYGWQDLYLQDYPVLGRRWMANCDIPDLDLLPARYGLKKIRFSAGLELGVLHLGLWGLSWLVRLGLPLDLPRHAGFLLHASNLFDGFGSGDGGMHMILSGTGLDGRSLERRWFILAFDGDGPFIPTAPAVVLCRQLATGQYNLAGAQPCVGLVRLEDCLSVLKDKRIETIAS